MKLLAGGVEVNALLLQVTLFVPPCFKLQEFWQQACDVCTKCSRPACQAYWRSAAPAGHAVQQSTMDQ
jgi:hypothetical protein